MPIPSATDRPAVQLAYSALFTALALVLSYLESLLPPLIPVAGIKLGLANAVVVLTFCFAGAKKALLINLARIGLSSLLFGNPISLIYSLCGALLSMGVMLLFTRTTTASPVIRCAAAGAAHNLGQLLCAMVLLNNIGLLYYLPILLLGGTISGTVIGLICIPLIQRGLKAGSIHQHPHFPTVRKQHH